MNRLIKRFTTLALLGAIAAFSAASCAFGASITLRALPAVATANSVWSFEAIWRADLDENGNEVWPSGDPDTPGVATGIIFLGGLGGNLNLSWLDGAIPMYHIQGTPSGVGGAVYRVSVSAGLSLSDPLLQPDVSGGITPDPLDPTTYLPTPAEDYHNLIWEPIGLGLYPMWYAANLQGLGLGVPNNVGVTAYGNVITVTPPEEEGGEPTVERERVASNGVVCTVWGSSGWTGDDRHVRYGEGGSQDYLRSYDNDLEEVIPLRVTPVLDMNPTTPWDGSSSHTFTFRVFYDNYGNLPPQNWGWGLLPNDGVVMYVNGSGIAMEPEAVDGNGLGIYAITVFPNAGNAYTSLPVGQYNYFFACSDDSLRFRMHPMQPYVLAAQPLDANGMSEWDYPYGEFPLDPQGTRRVPGLSPILDRNTPGRRYSETDGSLPDASTFVDRPVLVPEGSNTHPIVTCALTMPGADSIGIPHNDGAKYGGARFWGTLWPYKRMVNPRLPGSVENTIFNGARAEASAINSDGEVEFRIMWMSHENKPPLNIKVYVNKASARTKVEGTSNDTIDLGNGQQWITDSDSNYTYTGYTMVADPVNLAQVPNAYQQGVWYRYRMSASELGPGPHTFYFEATDGLQRCVWPRRPDSLGDMNVPTMSDEPQSAADLAAYDNNDFVPGPYVNSKPVLSDFSVTPSSGTAGQTFRFRVKYQDPDGHRPNGAFIYIQVDDEAAPVKYAMVPEIVINPTVDNRAIFKQGVYYYLDTATLQDMAMKPGLRRFYFEFTDDWGKQNNVYSRIAGETVITTTDGKQWKDGPYITGSIAPTLTNGSVESSDGTSNAATLWKFSVKYKDQNNDAPKIMKLFLGQLQPDGKTVLWDQGQVMLPADPSDDVYTDGAVYNTVTRLPGVVFSDDEPKQYFYAFFAYDGTAWATYDAAASDAASMVRNMLLTDSGDGQTFTFDHPALTGPIVGLLPAAIPVPQGELYDARVFKGGSITSIDGLTQLIGGTLAMLDGEKSGWQGEERYCVTKGIAANGFRIPSRDYVLLDNPERIGSVEGVYTSLAALRGEASDDPTNYYDPTLNSTADVTMEYVVHPLDITGRTVIVTNPGEIGVVLGVFSDAELTTPLNVVDQDGSALDGKGRIILDEANPLAPGAHVWVTYRRTGHPAGSKTIWLTTPLPETYALGGVDAGKTVYIKYHDIRFTNEIRGFASGTPAGVPGSLYFAPYGAGTPEVAFKGNDAGDPVSGLLGVWLNTGRTSENFVNAFRRQFADGTELFRLTTDAPFGGSTMYARYYPYGEYNIDRWSRKVVFKAPPGESVYATCVFGKPMKNVDGTTIEIGANTVPYLKDGKVTPTYGARTTSYVYSVIYQDLDGPNGQAPSYVRVYIDGQAYDMTPAGGGATPAYRDGALYTYTATNLSGGSHTFRFEASDGAGLVLFDKSCFQAAEGSALRGGLRYDPVNSTLGVQIVDIDGPWVNNPPTLANGVAVPNPGGTQTISPADSVDYTVVYADIDNDAPYVFDSGLDTIGSDIIGTPRVWIDSTGVNVSYSAKVPLGDSLVADPLEPSKKRTLKVVMAAGTDPGWETNYFAGKLMQITTGPNRGRVYLIQSNTSNTVSIATDDLAVDLKDYLVSGNVAMEIGFRINGLVMTKLNTDDLTYTDGAAYRITVPRLAVGNHAFHFTARSRVTGPSWFATPLAPYSDEVRFPTTGNISGPNVESKAPAENTAPELSTQLLMSGPYLKKVTLVTDSRAQLNTGDNWTVPEASSVERIEGLYLNASLDINTNYDVTNYLSTASTDLVEPFEFDLTSAVPAVAAGTELVQLGVPDGTSLLSVVPDAPGSIDTVVGVYISATMTGANYYGSFDGTKIALSSPLPVGTTRVYVKYTLSDGAALPPAYIRYFRVNPDTFLSGDPITYRVSYLDADNDPPTYHDGVQGYTRVVFRNSAGTLLGTPRQLATLAATNNYQTAVPMTVTLTDTPEGINRYFFQASDGYDPAHQVRRPVASADDYSIKVNYRPVLSNARVEPQAGLPSSEFTFRVTYRDSDYANVAPTVTVRLIKTDGGYVELPIYALTPEAGGAYQSGKNYVLKIPSTGVNALLPGTYSVAFEAHDGIQPATPVSVGSLSVRLTNNAPQIVSHSVAPTAGKSSASFVYRANYRDPDGDPPVVTVNNVRYEGLKLTIDKGTSRERVVVMTKTASAPANPDYTVADGILFETANGINGAMLGDAGHTYEIEATDGTLSATPATGTNVPIVLVPHFDQVRVVPSLAGDQSGAAAVVNPAVGDSVLIQGRIKFPKNAVTGKPVDETSDSAMKTSVRVTKPNGASFTLKAKMLMLPDGTDPNYWVGNISVATYPADGDSSLVSGTDLLLNASGDWKFAATRLADASWDPAETDETYDGRNDSFQVMVGGPMRTVAVSNPMAPDTSTPLVDMMTPAMVIADGDVGKIFGYDWAQQMQIVRWDPLSKTYYRYGSGIFPLLSPGEAVWIKPRTSYPAESIRQVDIDSGLLSNGNPGFALDTTKDYRLIHSFSKDYPNVAGSTTVAPCVIPLHAGWNQIGNIFFNWKKVNGVEVQPREDVGIPVSQIRVRYLGKELTLAQAAAAMPTPWIRDYAWRFDAATRQYVLVHSTATGAERVLKAWSGYWIRALVDCELVIDPNTTYSGGTLSAPATQSVAPSNSGQFDTPPAAP